MKTIALVANTDWYLYNFRLSLARDLRSDGNTVVLISPGGGYAARLQEAGFRWLEWNLGRQSLAPWKEAGALLSLARIYRHIHPDLVHHFTVKPVLYGSLAARMLHLPAVVNSVTGLGYIFLGDEPKARRLRRLVVPLYRLAFGHPNCAAIFENDTDRQFFIRSGLVPASRTYLIEGVGVDPAVFTPVPEPSGIPLVVLPARMLWDKGVGTLVEAARLLQSRLPLRIALVGEPDPGNPATISEGQLKEWDQEKIVEWWGWRQDMASVYQGCHIVCLPSLGEGIPTVLLEAAACGKPMIATDVPGCREVVVDGSNGYLVPPNDAAALAAALERLAAQPELRQRMGANGRQMILEKYTSEHVNQANRSIYHQLLTV